MAYQKSITEVSKNKNAIYTRVVLYDSNNRNRNIQPLENDLGYANLMELITNFVLEVS